MTVHIRKKKRRCSTKSCTLWRSAHLLHETSRPWTYAKAHSSHLLINVRLQECFQRRRPKLAQPVFSRSIANLPHCSVRVSTQTRDLGHFKLLKVRKGTFTTLSQTLSKNCPWGKNSDNTSTDICSTIRCKIQSCLKSQDNPKATQQTFWQVAPEQHLDNQRVNIFSTVRDKFDLDCNLWSLKAIDKRHSNLLLRSNWCQKSRNMLRCSLQKSTFKFLDNDT